MDFVRKRVTVANTLATLALLFAMTGGAYAAKKYVITSTKQISPKVVAALKGKAGANGSTGLAGSAGKEGPVGKEGAVGKEGSAGKNGTNGSNGAPGATGPTGVMGTTGSTGPSGPTGATGSPWTPNNALPAGATETGAWSSWQPAAEGATIAIPIGFAIQVSEPATFKATLLQPSEKTTECSGTAEKPTAASKNLCVYTTFKANTNLVGFKQAGKALEGLGATGTMMFVEVKEGETEGAIGWGTWAVTG